MVGAYEIILKSKRVQYEFKIRRQITIISGDSASGKTNLVNMIRSYSNYGTDSGITLMCDKECVVLEGRHWEKQLDNITNSIVFIDEGNRFILSKDFARKVKHSDNYYVIITREKLPNLPYSVNEIYGIKESGKYRKATQTYNELYNLYSTLSEDVIENPQLVITEDSNAGYQFFKLVGEQNGFECNSAKGKSNVKTLITKDNKEKTLLIVDGAAFGPEMREVMQRLERFSNYYLYTPESFEWLILKSKLIHTPPSISIEKILAEPEKFVETTKYFSWERYFASLLTQITADMKELVYSKDELANGYKQKLAITKILNVINKIKF